MDSFEFGCLSLFELFLVVVVFRLFWIVLDCVGCDMLFQVVRGCFSVPLLFVGVEYKFIQNHFHPKRVNFIPKPLSSQYHFHPKTTFIPNQFHPKTTFIPNQFHPKPLSSQNNFIQNQFHPNNDFDERTTANKSENNIVRVCVKASRGFSVQGLGV